jgi:outer membrane protein assembly factor BamD (BamD/ComL family)
MQKIRENVKSNPALAVSLVHEARRSFPESQHAEERDALLIDALINSQKIGAARSEAEQYLDRHPNGRFAAHIFAMTGASPRPKGPGR